MLSQKDFAQIQELIAQAVKTLAEKISFLPSKFHFDERMDKLTAEIQTVREEQTLHQGQHDEITERLDRVEQKVGLDPL